MRTPLPTIEVPATPILTAGGLALAAGSSATAAPTTVHSCYGSAKNYDTAVTFQDEGWPIRGTVTTTSNCADINVKPSNGVYVHTCWDNGDCHQFRWIPGSTWGVAASDVLNGTRQETHGMHDLRPRHGTSPLPRCRGCPGRSVSRIATSLQAGAERCPPLALAARLPCGPHCRLYGGLPQGRVRVDGVGQARQRHGERRLGYQVARAVTPGSPASPRPGRPLYPDHTEAGAHRPRRGPRPPRPRQGRPVPTRATTPLMP